MTDTTSVTMLMNADGDIVGASYERDGQTIRLVVGAGTSTDAPFSLRVLEGNQPILTAAGNAVAAGAQPSSTTLIFSAAGLDARIALDADSARAHVAVGTMPAGTVDFSAWPVLLTTGPLPQLALPADLERKLAPLEPVLRQIADRRTLRSNGVFTPFPTRPSTASPVATLVADAPTTNSLCTAACDAGYAAVGVACCAAACPTSACVGCALCAAASAAGASACHEVVCHE